MDDTPLASLSMTQVHYTAHKNPSDPLSLAFAWLAMLPHALAIVYAVLLYTTREIEIALTLAGQTACEVLNLLLKRYFKQARPEQIRHLGKGYGMPSNHSQFVAFFAAYMVLFLFFRHTPCAPAKVTIPGSSSTKKRAQPGTKLATQVLESDDSISPVYKLQLHHPKLTHGLLSLVAVATAILTAYSRVYLWYHTPLQVIVGCTVGTLFAGFWFGVTEAARRLGLVSWLLEFKIFRWARIRDLVCEQDLVEVGWQVWEEQRRVNATLPAKKGI